MTTLLSAGNNLSGNWYQETSQTGIRASGRLGLNVDQFSETFTAPNLVNAAVGIAFMIDDTPSGGATGIWTLTLQYDTTGGGAWNDVATGTWDMDANRAADTDQLFWIALSSPYTFTDISVDRYRWKLRSSATASQNRVRQSITSITNFAYIGFDNQTAIPSANDTIFVVHPDTKIDANVTLGNGTTGNGWNWTHAVYILTEGDLDFDPGGSYKLSLEGTMFVSGGGQFGSGVALDPGVTGTFEYSMSSYSNGDFYIKVTRGARAHLVGATRTISTKYASGAGTTGDPLFLLADIGLAVNDFILIGATENYEETEEKYIKSGSHGAGWVLADTLGGAESGLSYTHTTDADILSMTRNVKITTDDTAKGFRVDDDHLNTDAMAAHYNPNSVYQYVEMSNVYNNYVTNYQYIGMVIFNGTSTSYILNPSTKVASTHYDNIYAKTPFHTSGSSAMVGFLGAKNQTENGSFYTMSNTNPLYLGGVGNKWNDCTVRDNNWRNQGNAGGLGRTSTPINCTFTDCEFGLNQNNQIRIRSNISNLRFNNCTFEGSPLTIKADIGAYSWVILFSDCIMDDDSLGTGLQGGFVGSQIKLHNFNQTENEHYIYETNGISQATGSGLGDTTTRTAGHLGYRFQAEEEDAGLSWTFLVPVAANSSIGVIGFALLNSLFFNDANAELIMELFLPGSTTPDDSTIFSAAAADTWDSWALSGNYTGSVSSLATVKITAKTITAGAYAYIADLWNGTNEITNLNTWYEASPSPVMMQDFANPASVWASLFAGNTVDGTFGGLVYNMFQAWWNKKVLTKDSETQYTEVLYDDDGATPIRTHTLTRVGDEETRE